VTEEKEQMTTRSSSACYAELITAFMNHPHRYELVIDTPSPKRGIARIRCVRNDLGYDSNDDDTVPICLWHKDMHFDKCLELYRQILIARQKERRDST